MSVLSRHIAELESEFRSLDREAVGIVVGACCERAFATVGQSLEPAVRRGLRTALDSMWQSIWSAVPIDSDVADGAVKLSGELGEQVECNDDQIRYQGVTAIAAGLLFAASGDVSAAAYSACSVLDLVDLYVLNPGDVVVGAKHAVDRHPLMQAEIERQLADLRDVRSDATESARRSVAARTNNPLIR